MGRQNQALTSSSFRARTEFLNCGRHTETSSASETQQATNDAIALFGNKRGARQVLLRPYGEYLPNYLKPSTSCALTSPLPIGSIAPEGTNIIVLVGQMPRLRNILTSFDDFETDDPVPSRD